MGYLTDDRIQGNDNYYQHIRQEISHYRFKRDYAFPLPDCGGGVVFRKRVKAAWLTN